MVKKVMIELSLIKESSQISDADIIEEIAKELSNGDLIMPWCDKTEKISIN